MKRELIVTLGLVFLAAVLAMAQYSLDDYLLSLVCFVGIFCMLATSLNLTNGFTGLFSLGHPAFMAIGGYTSALLTFPLAKKPLFLPDLPNWMAALHLPFLPSLIIGGLVAALAAVIIGIPVLRLRGHYLAVATMGFLIIVQVVIINMDTITRGPLGLNGLDELTNVWWVYGWLAVTVYVCWKVKFSSYGRQFIAIRENEMAARCLGINVFKAKLQALVIGAFFAGVAGGLWGHLITALTPGSFSLLLAFTIVVMVVVGGSGSICGSLAGAVLFTIITEFFRPLEENLSIYGVGEICMALILIAILVFRPQGMFSCDEPKGLTPRPKNTVKP
ncbi:branched-chain amino acid ABC transporter permease [uncultured Pseudodesulfovibrio sp.]|uniref:branched-chain amino acid ABC transporter permease n=1 Tax=uncultured Pseudodesulfovibrio sp. TaxID=2035858 RepID=UPI0029C8C71A|nr:branched-chain amino acid ABC transporter permease [uncultured Pseudodesulfovibrio sp.]